MSVFILSGNDYNSISKELERLTKNKETQTANSVSEAYPHLVSKSLIKKADCYIVRRDTSFIKEERAWEAVDYAAKAKDLILIYDAIDKRTKFYKHYKSNIAVFEREEINSSYLFVRQLMTRQFLDALDTICAIDSSNAIGALSLTYNAIRKVLQIKTVPSGMNVYDTTGLSAVDIKFNSGYKDSYTKEALARLMTQCANNTESIKSGILDAKDAMRHIVFVAFAEDYSLQMRKYSV